MSVDTEFAVRKDIRNNPLREIDSRHRGELHRYMLLVALGVVLFLFSAWQRARVQETVVRIENLKLAQAQEESSKRQLRLNLETFSADQVIVRGALELGLHPPSPSETLVIELAPAPTSTPPPGVVAQAR